MIRKSVVTLCVALACMVAGNKATAQQGKAEIGLSYGYYSMFTLYNGAPFNTSSGTSSLNLRYYLNNAVTLGINVGYENNSSYGSFLTFAPECTFRYLDTRDNRIRVRLYGAAGFGLTVFNDNEANQPGHRDNTGPKLWGFQGTALGVRVGRKLAGFAEVGYGYKGLLNGGLSYRFRAAKKKGPAEHKESDH
jgi:hypothetical protein